MSRQAPSIAEKKSRAGTIGGMQTLLRHGREHYAAAGRLGGRPRAITILETRQSLEGKENENRRMDTRRSSLKNLKELWEIKSGRGGLHCPINMCIGAPARGEE